MSAQLKHSYPADSNSATRASNLSRRTAYPPPQDRLQGGSHARPLQRHSASSRLETEVGSVQMALGQIGPRATSQDADAPPGIHNLPPLSPGVSGSSSGRGRLRYPLTARQREHFWDYVNKTETCWLWTGLLNQAGYGHFRYGSLRDGTRGVGKAHRIAYFLVRGDLPSGLTIDHLCQVRACVYPEHLEPVTHQENMRRAIKGVCRRAGHPLQKDATGKVRCPACAREAGSQRRRQGVGPCSISACERGAFAKGLCAFHYQQSRRLSLRGAR